MKLTNEHIKQMIRNEINGKETVNEEVSDSDMSKLRDMIRKEIALVFFELFKKRSVWM